MVRADNLKFKEEGVRDILKDVFLPWYNAYRFLIQNCQRLHAVSHSTTPGGESLSEWHSTLESHSTQRTHSALSPTLLCVTLSFESHSAMHPTQLCVPLSYASHSAMRPTQLWVPLSFESHSALRELH